jgi:predicted TPR repeat methyltransferase
MHPDPFDAFRRGDLPAAEAGLRRALASDPRNPDLVNGLGMVLFGRGRAAEGARLVRRATQMRPDDPGLRVNLALVSLAAGLVDDAVTAARAAVARGPRLAPAHAILGRALAAAGDIGGARSAFDAALDADPAFAPAHLQAATLAETVGDLGAARDHLAAAMRHRPTDGALLASLARLQALTGQADTAIATARRAVVVAGAGHAAAHAALGLALMEAGRPEDALVPLERAAALAPADPDIARDLGAARMLAGDLAGAEATFRALLARTADDADGWNNLGAVVRAAGRRDEAAAAFRTALAHRPDHPRAGINLAGVLTDMGDADGARAALTAVLARTPDDPTALHMLAALGGAAAPPRAADEYVRGLFDRFAATFERTLDGLDYRAPALLVAALDALPGPSPRVSDDSDGAGLRILDAGCGTGLCGPLLRPRAARLDGVDLSAGMLAQARARSVYDALDEAELTAYLRAHPASWDLIVAADVLCYFGDLGDVLSAAARALVPGGWIAFSVEAAEGGHVLGPGGRYAHGADHVAAAATAAGFAIAVLEEAVLRREAERSVTGRIVVARTAG